VSGERHSGKGCFFKKRGNTLPRVLGMGHSGKRIFKKIKFLSRVQHLGKMIFIKKENFLPRVLHSGKSFFKKKRRTVLTVLILPRVLGRHSGKASPSARDLALGEGLFPVKHFPGRPSPSVAVGEAFPEYFLVFPECI
jgi:hypothetical protein